VSEDSGQGADDVGAAKSTKPYLLRAIYEWAVDNRFTPQILVSAASPEVVVPTQYVKDGQIVLNIHPHSVKDIELGNEYLMFSARFVGNSFDVSIPIAAVMAIYARENGQGIVFQGEGGVTPPSSSAPGNKGVMKKSDETNPGKKDSNSSHLKLVK